MPEQEEMTTETAVMALEEEQGYAIAIEQFEGPLSVLLQLIEQHELDITEISLAEICNTFIKHLDQVEEKHPEDLADFLVIATKLLYLKSRTLLPYLEPDDEVEEEDPGNLAERLKMYKEFRDAADILEQRVLGGFYAVPRNVRVKQLDIVEFSPPEHLTKEDLEQAFVRAVDKMEVAITLPKAAIKKAVSLKDRISTLANLLQQHKTLRFDELVDRGEADRTDVVVTFLAVLELVKQQTIAVEQNGAYSDIVIHKDHNIDAAEVAEIGEHADEDYA